MSNLDESWWDRHPRLRWAALIGFIIYAAGPIVLWWLK